MSERHRDPNGKKPIAIGFELGCRNTANLPDPGGFRVRYKCPKCGKELCRWLGSNEKHCHSCGQKINWRVVTYLNSSQSDSIEKVDDYVRDSIIKAHVKMINSFNKERNFDSEVYISEFESSKESHA